MRMTKLFLLLASISALVISSDGSALAGSANAPLPVSVVVANNCTIATAAVTFAGYDPLSSTATDSTGGSVTITCTQGAATTIGLNFGTNTPAGPASMANGTYLLPYALYSDSGRTTLWGGTTFAPPVAPSKAARTYPVYGRIPAGTDVPSGTYTDTVQATVNF
jgi:spore coat protein U-like protein